MKQLLSLLACFGLLLAPLAVTTTITGCSNQTTNGPVSVRVQAGQSLETIAVSVNGAMNTYGVLFRAGKVSEVNRVKITSAYATYQAAAKSALILLGSDKATSPPDVAKLAQELIALTSSL